MLSRTSNSDKRNSSPSHSHLYLLCLCSWNQTRSSADGWQTRATRLQVSQGKQTCYHSIC